MAVSSTSSTGSASGLASPGIGSGLDVTSIVAKLMSVEQQPLTALQSKVTAYQSTISAFGTIKGALSSFQTALAQLLDPAKLLSLKATPGSAGVLSTTAGAGAVAGSYSVEVTQLAKAQKLVSGGFANATDAVGSGTLTFQFGTASGSSFTANGSATQTVAIGAGQNTLSGIRDAVNAANIGVTATIVNDGTASGNRLVFTSGTTGAANSLKISAADDDGNNVDAAGLSQLAYDPATTAGSGRNLAQNVAAQDAQLTIDGIAVSKATNTITDAIQGVTLNLLQTNIGTPTSVAVTQDASSATQAVQAFVSSYNSLHSTLSSLTKFDATSKQASVLTGDSTVRLIENQLRGIIGGSVSGLGDNLNTLAQAGITYQSDGSLALDSTKLATAIASNPHGITDLFAAQGHATDSLVGVAGTGTKTQSGTYGVNVTQLATRGNLVAGSAAGLTITAGVNDALAVTVDGIATTVTLAAGTYASASALAAEMQSKINGSPALVTAGSTVAISQAGGILSVVSNRYGSASNVSVGGAAATSLFGASPAATAGVDVAGTINGVAATGSGQTLSGVSGSPVDGLQLAISGGGLGSRGTITYTQGYAYQLTNALRPMLASDGILAARTDGLNSSIKDTQRQEDTMQIRLDAIQARYTAQFSALDTMLASMQTTSTYLTQQLANLPTPGKSTS